MNLRRKKPLSNRLLPISKWLLPIHISAVLPSGGLLVKIIAFEKVVVLDNSFLLQLTHSLIELHP